ncbi:hypothetical protein [Fodinibius salsisoli]|uniref:Uncharacterized protein n=1 Tax=Fodinibius salsisoli TaxID=2820877 RepID=A0ABT3PLS7_9BACT|nr:hypothetical protein [Fodinibius salsisoli]MCW9706905.1 hypothetical protein [Fodinibius salsisoli]
MSFEEMVVALVGAIGGIALVGFIVAKVTGLIKAWINRTNTKITEKDFDRLAKAFVEHKKDTNRRIQNLEAIISEDSSSSTSSADQIEAPKQTIEIDEQEEQQESTEGNNNNLRNMLNE